jgi:toxin FitB
VRILLDTNVLSEVRRPRPDEGVLAWLDDADEDRFFISVISLAEIRRGSALLEDGKRKTELNAWLENDLPQRFAGRVLPVDEPVAIAWGDLMAHARRKGIGLASLDALIAATAQAHGLILATRNVKDFENLGLNLLDPWGV